MLGVPTTDQTPRTKNHHPERKNINGRAKGKRRPLEGLNQSSFETEQSNIILNKEARVRNE